MAKVRQDAWSHEDDLLLAETVLRHIRQGSTQLNAFEEVGDRLNRTSAACGFRWNAEVRQDYEQAVDIAKRQRKQYKREQLKDQKNKSKQPALKNLNISEHHKENIVKKDTESKHDSLDLDKVINYLVDLKQQNVQSNQKAVRLSQLENENKQLTDENNLLNKQVKSLEKKVETIQEDYQAFLQIMDRARKMVVFEEDVDESKLPTFVMDKNGNLEPLAK